MGHDVVFSLGGKVLAGGRLTFDEAMRLAGLAADDVPILLGVANKVRACFAGDTVDTCAIVSARSGGCSEDCKFCAQSACSDARIDTYPLMDGEEIVRAARQAEASGAHRFSIVTAGCGMRGDADFPRITAALERIGRETGLQRCCSLGILGPEEARALKAAGVTRYHHNLEAARSYFPAICSTHTYDERVATIRHARDAGLEVCSGGIIGLGEGWEHRVELAFALRELDVASVPVNVLDPIPGTALGDRPPLKPLEVLQTLAVFRLILPDKCIRYAGGREKALGELVPLGFLSGVNGMLIGDYLTTAGRGAAADLATVRRLGLKPHGGEGLSNVDKNSRVC
jgi:biotin synthase